MERLRRRVREKPALSLAVMGLLLAGSIYASAIRPLQFQLEGLEKKLLRAQSHQEQIDLATARLSRVKEDFTKHHLGLRNEKGLLDDEHSPSEAISRIVQLAVLHDLRPIRVSPSNPFTEESLTYWPTDLDVEGGFHDLGRFFQDLAGLETIVNIRKLSITNRRDPSRPATTLGASISLNFVRINLREFDPDREPERQETP